MNRGVENMIFCYVDEIKKNNYENAHKGLTLLINDISAYITSNFDVSIDNNSNQIIGVGSKDYTNQPEFKRMVDLFNSIVSLYKKYPNPNSTSIKLCCENGSPLIQSYIDPVLGPTNLVSCLCADGQYPYFDNVDNKLKCNVAYGCVNKNEYTYNTGKFINGYGNVVCDCMDSSVWGNKNKGCVEVKNSIVNKLKNSEQDLKNLDTIVKRNIGSDKYTITKMGNNYYSNYNKGESCLLYFDKTTGNSTNTPQAFPTLCKSLQCDKTTNKCL